MRKLRFAAILSIITFILCSGLYTNNNCIYANVNRAYNSNGDMVLDIKYDISDVNINYKGSPELNYSYMVEQLDMDGDGLTDYEELHKYLTDPQKADSDGDGISDGDWNERREYTYTISAVREIDKWFNSASLTDTFEDIRIISETRDMLKYEVLLYPYADDVVTGNPNWLEYQKDLKFEALLKPGKTTNWDKEMQKIIVESIPKDCKTDLDVVKFLVPTYFSRRVNPDPSQVILGVPTDLSVDLRDSKTIISSANVDKFINSRTNKNQTDEEFIRQILFAKTIFNDRIMGACTASATYMTAVLRAAGIPARMIETNSLLDNSDKKQRAMIGNLKNEVIRNQLLSERPTYAGHHYIEAYVGGRWIKINNDNTIMAGNYLIGGTTFCVKSDTYFDLADTPVSDIWRNGFPGHMPYRLITLSDSYGTCYDASRQPYFIKSIKYGLDIPKFSKISIYGGRLFCESIRDELKPVKISWMGAYGYNTDKGPVPYESDWMGNCLIIISNETDYTKLYYKIRPMISKDEYYTLKSGQYKTLKVDNAAVLIIGK